MVEGLDGSDKIPWQSTQRMPAPLGNRPQTRFVDEAVREQDEARGLQHTADAPVRPTCRTPHSKEPRIEGPTTDALTVCWRRTRQLTHLLGEVAQGILLLNLVEVEGQQELLEIDEERKEEVEWNGELKVEE